MSDKTTELGRMIYHSGLTTANDAHKIAKHLLSLGMVFMPRLFEPEHLDLLELGSVAWVFDNAR